jgi:hypothetical protein
LLGLLCSRVFQVDEEASRLIEMLAFFCCSASFPMALWVRVCWRTVGFQDCTPAGGADDVFFVRELILPLMLALALWHPKASPVLSPWMVSESKPASALFEPL